MCWRQPNCFTLKFTADLFAQFHLDWLHNINIFEHKTDYYWVILTNERLLSGLVDFSDKIQIRDPQTTIIKLRNCPSQLIASSKNQWNWLCCNVTYPLALLTVSIVKKSVHFYCYFCFKTNVSIKRVHLLPFIFYKNVQNVIIAFKYRKRRK